jgi:hypothetical protein
VCQPETVPAQVTSSQTKARMPFGSDTRGDRLCI